MAKKQLKIAFQNVSDFIANKEKLSFVLKNASVILGYPVSAKGDILKVKNTRGQKLELTLSQIEEIWAEKKVSS